MKFFFTVLTLVKKEMDITSNLIRRELEFMGFKRNVLFLQIGKEVSQYFKRLAKLQTLQN